MTKEKETANLRKAFICILAAFTISLFWEVNVLKSENIVPVDKSLAAIQKMTALQARTANAEIKGVSAEKEPIDKTFSAGTPAVNTVTETAIEKVHNEPTANENKQEDIPVVASDVTGETVPDDIYSNANRGGAATRKETDVLIRLINAEAYGLSYKAKVAVGQVVMNRWVGPYYGDDLLAIMTAPHQFTPIYDGSAYKKEIEPDSIKAAYAVLEGNGVEELTNDTYYFVNPDFTEDKTIENKMQFVCEIEGIHFFKPPAK